MRASTFRREELRDLRRVAGPRCPDAMYRLSEFSNRHYTELYEDPAARRRLVKAAKLGSRDAQYAMGAFLATGDPFPKSAAAARRWYLRAAKHGNGEAQYNLGSMFMDGEGGVVDHKRALFWLGRSVRNGYDYAAKHLAEVYEEGHYGLEKSLAKASVWRRIAPGPRAPCAHELKRNPCALGARGPKALHHFGNLSGLSVKAPSAPSSRR
jgi:TPR repeat protein